MRRVGRIRDVTKQSGLSVATVSRVMNGAANVRPATRERVPSVCEKLNYVPNPAARALSTNKSRTIAAIIPTIEHSVFAKYIAAIEQTLDERDYSLVMAISNADQAEELKAARKLLGMGAEAFILTGAAHRHELFNMFERRQVPYVLTSIWDPNGTSKTIGYDNAALAVEAVTYLASHGHREIAVIHGPLHESDRTQARKSGASNAGAETIKIDFSRQLRALPGANTPFKTSSNPKADTPPFSVSPTCWRLAPILPYRRPGFESPMICP